MIENKFEFDLDPDIPGVLDYVNIASPIGAVISSKLATLHECDTVYSVEDVYLMLEVAGVDAHNRRAAEKNHERKRTNR
jgi:hypothetical protein